jgi:hypothetical protein
MGGTIIYRLLSKLKKSMGLVTAAKVCKENTAVEIALRALKQVSF